MSSNSLSSRSSSSRESSSGRSSTSSDPEIGCTLYDVVDSRNLPDGLRMCKLRHQDVVPKIAHPS